MAEREGKEASGWFRRNKQILAFCCLLLAITWSLFFWQAGQDRRETIKEKYAENDLLVRAYEEYVNLTMESVDGILCLLQAEYEKKHAVTPAIETVLANIPKTPYINQCLLVDADGCLLASAFPAAGRPNLRTVDFFALHRSVDTDRPYIGRPRYGVVSGKLSIHISRRLNNADGSFAGIVSIAIHPDQLTRFFNDMDLQPGNVIRVVGIDGIIRASRHSGSRSELGEDLSKGAILFDELARTPVGHYFTEGRFYGIPRYFSYRMLAAYPLVVQVGESEDSVMAPFQVRLKVYFAVAVAVSLFILLYSAMLLRTHSRRHQAERRYRALMDQSFDAVAIIEPSSLDILEINPRFSELLGYTAADLPRKANGVINVPESEAREVIARLMDEGCLPPKIRPAVAKDGRIIPVERVSTIVTIGTRRLELMTLRNLSKERLLEKEIAADAALARRIQQALLPQIPSSPYADVLTYYRPLRLVSGDTLGLRWDKTGTILTGYLIDVSGHGLATAMQTAALGVLLRQATELSLPLAGQLAWLNAQIPQYFEEESFAAAIMFELDVIKGELRYAGGGITEFYRNGVRVPVPGRFLGLGSAGDYEEVTLNVCPGDVFCFLTDGLGEVIRGSGGLAGKAAREIIAGFEAASLSEKLYDDASAICIEVRQTAADPAD